MRKELYFAMFVAGMAVSSVVTWHCVKKKYEKIAQKEIDSVKEVFSKRALHPVAEDILNKAEKKTGEIEKEKQRYAEILRDAGYTADDGDRHPYVISPEEFGEFEDYEKISLIYYADEVLADENDEIVDDVEDIVGDALNHFGEYEDDSVFVRCDERKCDYEILLDNRDFVDVTSMSSRPVEVR